MQTNDNPWASGTKEWQMYEDLRRSDARLIQLAEARGREEFASGWNLDECPYPDDGEMRTAWISAWRDAEEAAKKG